MSLSIHETAWCNPSWRNFNVYRDNTLIGTTTIRKSDTRMSIVKIRLSGLWTCPKYDSVYNPADITGSILREFRFSLPKFD